MSFDNKDFEPLATHMLDTEYGGLGFSDAHMHDLENLPDRAQQIIEHLTEGNSIEELAILYIQQPV